MSAYRRPLLGHLLVEAGIVTEDELRQALLLHEQTGKPLGAILTDDLGLVSVPTLADTLLLQQRWRPLGEMLVENGIIDEEQLLDALDEQERTGKPLGVIVRERFYLSQAMLDKLLEQQRRLEIELERGYGSGLRAALLGREGPEEGGEQRDLGLSERVGLGRAGADPRVILAAKAIEHRDGKLASLGEQVEHQRSELDRVRDALQERQLMVIELEQRVEELESLLAAASGRPTST